MSKAADVYSFRMNWPEKLNNSNSKSVIKLQTINDKIKTGDEIFLFY